jgi:hypothetical protein
MFSDIPRSEAEMDASLIQLSKLIDRSEPVNVLNEVRRFYSSVYDRDSFTVIERSFMLITALFRGDFPGYKKCSTQYHDLDHTLDAFLATARILDGIAVSDTPMPAEHAKRALLAAIFHDTGYIQKADDDEGTGAKYTKEHVERSELFVTENVDTFSLSAQDADEILILIACTDICTPINALDFSDRHIMLAGKILGTADLLGQMSDRAYLEKLLFLYYEFKEAGVPGFDTEFDILKKTRSFYEITMKRLDTDLSQVYRFAAEHFLSRYSVGRNLYIESIERQMKYLDEIINDNSTNFRKKLKRLDLETIEPSNNAHMQ